jgi:uncharacterized protein (TIGR00730 family)
VTRSRDSLAICVFCSSSEAIDPAYLRLAAEVGTELAVRGHRLVSGGGSVSCMGAVARAARSGGAHTAGIIPAALHTRELADFDADELLVTETMRERKAEMDARADAFLALPGGLGTLEELLEVWTARVLGLHDKPVVVLDPDGIFAPLRAQLELLVDRGFARAPAAAAVTWTREVAEALDACARRPAAVRVTRIEHAKEQLEADVDDAAGR